MQRLSFKHFVIVFQLEYITARFRLHVILLFELITPQAVITCHYTICLHKNNLIKFSFFPINNSPRTDRPFLIIMVSYPLNMIIIPTE